MEPTPPVPIERVGVVGAGQMGAGIAQVCAMAGLHVRLFDARPDVADKALAAIGGTLDRQIAKGATDLAAKASAMARLEVAHDLAAMSDRDLVVEAVTEKEAAKRAVYEALKPHLSAACLLASNTSAISITRLGAASDRPDRFIGMHFMYPAPKMKLLEIIRGIATGEPAFAASLALAERLGKTVAVSEDFPAFIVNRVLVPMINEAVYALHEGVGSIDAIDSAMRLGANHPMGPLELADFIGLDTCLSIMQVLHEGLGDGKYRPCPLLVKYVEAGWLGRKAGRGFYDHTRSPPRPTR